MFRFIQPLESRRLLTATAATLDAELAAVTTAGATVKADLTAVQTTVKTDDAKLAADLKGTAKTNAALLKKLVVDEAVFYNRIKADTTALLKSTTTSTKSVADGKAVVANPALAAGGKIQADINSLTTSSTTPLAKLTTDAATTTIEADIDAIVAANASTAGVPTDAATAKADIKAAAAKLLADANTYSGTVGTLKTDMTTLLPQPTTTPSLIGDYKGTISTKGVIFGIGGQNLPLEIVVTSQTLTTLGGSISVDNNTASGTITVTELSTGKVTFDINNSGIVGHMSGQVNVKTTPKGFAPGTVISGSGTFTVNGNKIDGNFSLTKVT